MALVVFAIITTTVKRLIKQAFSRMNSSRSVFIFNDSLLRSFNPLMPGGNKKVTHT